ncbi:MAG: ABC transporter transmembrane domain-containing protein [Rhodospirillales bacterium]
MTGSFPRIEGHHRSAPKPGPALEPLPNAPEPQEPKKESTASRIRKRGGDAISRDVASSLLKGDAGTVRRAERLPESRLDDVVLPTGTFESVASSDAPRSHGTPDKPSTETAGAPPSPPGDGSGRDIPDELPPPDDNDMASALHGLREKTDISNCLIPLLKAMQWRGHPRHIAESIPHFLDTLDITAFRNVFANLRYESWPIEIDAARVDTRLLPCLYLPEGRDAMVLIERDGDMIKVFDGGEDDEATIPIAELKGTAYVFHQLEEEAASKQIQQRQGWFRMIIERFRTLGYQVLGLTLILNLLALATPLFVMAVYDKVVATGSLPTLSYFAIGVGIAIMCDLIIRGVRSRVLAFIGARLDNIVGNAVFQRILFLPPAFTERATVGAQVARIKDFETVREFFTGPMALTFFELPFTFIFVIVIAALAGPLAFVPLLMIVVFIVLGFVIQPLIQGSVARAAKGGSRRQELLVETLGNMRAVKTSGAEEKWLERYRDYSARASLNSFYTAQYGSLLNTISSILMTASGLGTVAFGVFRVLGGNMTIGALVASMILVWRILAPLQMAFVSMTRITQVRSSVAQINGLMNLKAERETDSIVIPLKRFVGRISFSRVSLRYSPEADPALVGVTFDVEPGEVVAIVGGNGSGKSTLLKLLAGLYVQQAGSVRIDDQDVRQLDVIELRHAISYVPQVYQFFYGTIAQNLRLTHPTASDEELWWACKEAGVLEDVLALEQGSGKWKRSGFEVRIGDSAGAQMPTSLLQRLNLARGYLKRAPIMLFDEPGNGLDYEGDQTFMKKVERLRGNTTVFLVTHRPSHLRMADKIVWMDTGHVRAVGPADQIREQLPKDFL